MWAFDQKGGRRNQLFAVNLVVESDFRNNGKLQEGKRLAHFKLTLQRFLSLHTVFASVAFGSNDRRIAISAIFKISGVFARQVSTSGTRRAAYLVTRKYLSTVYITV